MSRQVTERDREALQAEVASRYYIEGFSQEEIARQIERSVATVSRLLAQARENRFVEVHIDYPVPVAEALQAELVRQFGLRVARVARASSSEPHRTPPQVSALAARYVSTLLTDGAVISAAAGTTTREVVSAMPAAHFRDVQVVQGIGSLGSRLPSMDNPLVTKMLAERIGATAHLLPAPMIVESPSVRDALADDPHFRGALGLCSRLDIALIGIGSVDPARSIICRAGYLEPWAMERIRAAGAVGDIIAEFFDLHGQFLDTEVTARVVGMRRTDLHHARHVVAVASGAAKGEAILGALRTGLIDVLVTDDFTARKVLELARAYPVPNRGAGAAEARRRSPAPVPGNRRDAVRDAILQSTLQVLARDGYLKLSIDAVAALAAVPRQEVFNGWRIKADLVRDAFAAVISPSRVACGAVGQDLEAFLTALFAGAPGDEPNLSRAHRTMLVESLLDPALHRMYIGLQQTWRAALIEIVDGAVARGELAGRVSSSMLADMLLGPIWFRLRMDTAPIEPAFLHEVVGAVVEWFRMDGDNA